jgi:hypothetical protein
VVKAIISKKDTFIKWPSDQELKECSSKMARKYQLPNIPLGKIKLIDKTLYSGPLKALLFIPLGVDGVLIKLHSKPWLKHIPAGNVAQDYWCRKGHYALNMQVIGDANGYIR